MSRAQTIEAILSVHQKHNDGGLVCRCGYRFPLGASIHEHRATLIDAAVTLYDAGINPERIPDAALAISAFRPA